MLDRIGIACDEAAGGIEGVEAARQRRYDLLLLDIDMPGASGPEVLRQLREDPPYPHLKVIMMSGRFSGDEMSALLAAGADDYLSKPFSIIQMQHRVQAALRLKAAQDRSDLLLRQLHTVNSELEQGVQARDCDLIHARNALVLALAELVGHRDLETGAHLLRLQSYCRCLAEESAGSPGFSEQVDSAFVGLLECCAPLHDIGKAGIPDEVLLKPGALTAEERAIMQTHTTIGAATLQKVARKHGFSQPFFQMAIEVTRHHHERWDGSGYPDRLAGDSIPLAARIVALADVYDALRARRVYKPALSHDVAVRIMLEQSPGHFDPALLPIFQPAPFVSTTSSPLRWPSDP